jgi:serine phosphatase RsbU (regulator of sigma subunit)
VRSDPHRTYRANDLTFAEELATRIAFAVENATLLERYERRAETMQRSLLPDVPATLRGLSLGHLYRPADDLARVGGDWFDAFGLKDGSVALVIGDMIGHDLHAATRMGAIRHKLRAIATDRMTSPSDVIFRLDDIVDQLGAGDMATLVYARLIPPRHPAMSGSGTGVVPTSVATSSIAPTGGWSMEWSNAGHLPPLLLEPAREPRLLTTDPDLPIGVSPSRRTDHRHAISAGTVVVLFTDGLVERAGRSLDGGLARLIDATRTLHSVDVHTLSAQIVAAVDPAASDDLAILAVHVP